MFVSDGISVAFVDGSRQVLHTQVLLQRVRAAPAALLGVADREARLLDKTGLLPLFDCLSILGLTEVLDGVQRGVSIHVFGQRVCPTAITFQLCDRVTLDLESVVATTLFQTASTMENMRTVLAWEKRMREPTLDVIDTKTCYAVGLTTRDQSLKRFLAMTRTALGLTLEVKCELDLLLGTAVSLPR